MADSTGGVLVGATVTVTNTQTGATATQQANSSGIYVFPNLLPGIYNVKVEMDGFVGAARNRVELQIQQTIRMDFRLELGTLNETVEAVASAPMISTEDLTIGTVIENRRIVELPLNGRNFLKMVELTPNVSASFSGSGSSGPRQGGDRSTQQLSIGGGRREWNYFTLDGINNTDVNFNSYIFLPSIDALQEFKVQTGVYSAEFGRELGQVSVTTKARHERLSRLGVRVPPERRVRRAPVRVCRGGAEIESIQMESVRIHVRRPGAASADVQRQGQAVFHGQLRGIPPPQPAGDALQRAVGGDAKRRFLPGQYGAQRSADERPFPGNIIPKDRIDPISLALLDYYPAPNQPGYESGEQLPGGEPERNQQEPVHYPCRLGGEPEIDVVPRRYSWTDESIFAGGFLLNGSSVATSAHQVVVDNARVLTHDARQRSARRLQHFLQSRRWRAQQRLRSRSAKSASSCQRRFLPMPGERRASASPDSRGSATIPSRRSSIATRTCSSSTTSRGRTAKHFFKFGGEVRFDHYDQDGNQFARGSAGFANNVATGNALADYLLGYLNTWSYTSGLAVARLHATSQAYYIADTWKIKPSVTVNLGLRYEFIPPWTDSAQRQIVADIPLNTQQPQVPDRDSIRCSSAQGLAISIRTPTSGIRQTFR